MLSQTITTFVETITTTTAQVVAQAIIHAPALETIQAVSQMTTPKNRKQTQQARRLSTKKKSQSRFRTVKSSTTKKIRICKTANRNWQNTEKT